MIELGLEHLLDKRRQVLSAGIRSFQILLNRSLADFTLFLVWISDDAAKLGLELAGLILKQKVIEDKLALLLDREVAVST
jgi:hypothetical protein